MSKLILIACVAALSMGVCACSTAGQQAILTDLQGCERHYDGTINGGMTGGAFSGKATIDCPSAKAPPVMPPTTR